MIFLLVNYKIRDTAQWGQVLLLRTDMISHEGEISIWWDERQDTLRLPTLKPYTWVETDIV